MLVDVLRAALGVAFFCGVAALLSTRRGRFPWRVVFVGLVLQVVLGIWTQETESGRAFFGSIATFVGGLIEMAKPGAELVFGPLSKPEVLGPVFGGENAFVFAFAGAGLPAIIFFSALMAVLYHFGVMQVVVWLLARVMSATMRVSGAESMAMAANVFVGQTEAPLVIRPYLARLTTSELNSLMVGGFATIAGSVLAVYMGMVGPEIGPHLLTASVMSAPAAFVIAKIMVPEVEQPSTSGVVELRIERNASNVFEAAANGTSDGLKLWLNVLAMLIAFTALVALVDWPLEAWFGTSLREVFGYVFAPVAWLMGVDGWHDCRMVGSLLGTKVAMNEFIAYSDMSKLLAVGSEVRFESMHSAKIAAYALCGFANFASIGIQIGGIGALVPERRTDLAKLGLKAMIGGAFAACMTATIAGIFV
jgi:CNT family concentrative nucleoside transporter